VRDELEQVLAVDGGVAEALPIPEPVRVQAATADPHHRAGETLRRQRAGTHLPGHCGRVVEDAVEAARHDIQASVSGARIGRAE
jgi:hypothetical protein